MHPESDNTGTLEMTQYEYDLLKEAYDTTMSRTGEEEEFAQMNTLNMAAMNR